MKVIGGRARIIPEMDETVDEVTHAEIPVDATPRRRGLTRRVESDLVHRVSRIVTETADPFTALITVTEEVARVFKAGLVGAMILGEGLDGHHLALSDPALREQADALFSEQIRRDDGLITALRQSGFQLRTDGPPASAPIGWRHLLGAERLGPALLVPFIVRGVTEGGLVIVREPGGSAFDESETWAAESIAGILALSIGASARANELDQFFATSLELLCMIDRGRRLHRLNPQGEKLLGYEPGRLEGFAFLDLVHPDDRPATAAALDDLFEVQVPAQFDNRLRTADGSYREFEWLARPGRDLVYAAGRDVTDLKRQARALKESEDRYRLIAENINDVVFVMDLEGMTIEYVSPSIMHLTGHLPEELIGRTPFAILSPEAQKRAMESTEAHTAGSESGDAEAANYLVQTEFSRKGGDQIPVELSVKVLLDADGKARKHVTLCRDITVRKVAEEALRESEESFRLIADNVADVIWILDLATMRLSYVSPSVERLRGYTPAEVMLQDVHEVVTPRSYEKVMGLLRSSMERAYRGEQVAVESLEIEQPRKEGGVVSTEIITRLLSGPDGRPNQVLGVSRDITLRLAAETALRDSRKRLEDLVFVVGDWIWESDAEFRYTLCSEGVRSVLGYEPADVIGKRPWDFMVPEDAEKMREHARERAARKEGCTEVVNRNLRRDGREVVLLTSCVPILNEYGDLAGFRGIDKDITIATQTQESLRRSVVELNALWQIAETVAGPDDLSAALTSVTRQVSDALEAHFALVVTFGEGGEGRNVIASTKADTAWCEELFLGRSQQHMPGLAKVAASGEPLVLNDLTSGPLPPLMAESARAQGFSRLLVIPLVLQTETIGVLGVTRSEDAPPFRERDIEFAQAAAGSVAAAVVHARLRVEENLKTASQVRDHLARELHDAVTQSVYSASLIAQALPAIWKRSPDDAMNGLGQLQRLVRSALAELRILLYELRPGSLAGVGLDQLIERLGDSLAGQADVTVTVEARIGVPPPAEVKEALYRIAQEAFNNIAKHARASNVSAAVVADATGAVLTVEDDGVGLDTDPVEGDHHGLAIMGERAEEIGAQLRIGRIEPAGTRLMVRWTAPDL